MKILALDPGLAAMGVAIMEKGGQDWVPVKMICLRTEKQTRLVNVRASDDLVRRVVEQAVALRRIVREHSIKRVVSEMYSVGAQSAAALRSMMLSAGMLATFMELEEIAVEWYSPWESRKAAGVPGQVRARGDVKEIVMSNMGDKYPSLNEIGTKADREHIADALSVFEAARSNLLVRSA